MNIQHFEKGFHYSDTQLLQVARKVGKLATWCKRLKAEDSFIRIEAEVRSTKKERDQVKVMVSVNLPQKNMWAESRRPDVIEAVDRCIEKLEPQVKRYKEMRSPVGRVKAKSRTKKRRNAEQDIA